MPTEWYFPRNDDGEEQGLNDAGIETFRTESSLAREVIQNCVDAVSSPEQPVEVVFTRLDMPASVFPGRQQLRTVFLQARDYVASQCLSEEQRLQNRVPFLERAAQLLEQSHISFLRVSDFNTTGLRGSEADKMSAWTRLIRKQGASSVHGAGGGTFGIGQRAPFASSALRTVFYSTFADGVSRFIGKSIICSFRDYEGEVRRNIGYWGEASERSVRSVADSAIPSDFRRTRTGLDLYVAGFDAEGWLGSTVDAVLLNAFAAIEHGRLVVRIEDGNSVTFIERKSLLSLLERRAEQNTDGNRQALRRTSDYVRALRSSVCISRTLPRCGAVSLYVHRDVEAANKVAYMRRPRMLVYERTKNLLQGYAAVLLCDSDVGNARLGSLEDPTHRSWERGRVPGGQGVLGEIQSFVADALREIGESIQQEEEDVPDLSHFLPEEEQDFDGPAAPRGGRGPRPTAEETTVTVVKPVQEVPLFPSVDRPKPSQRGPGTQGADEGELGGSGSGGDQSSGHGGGPEPGSGVGPHGQPGDEDRGSREAEITFRAFQTDAIGEYEIVLHSSKHGAVDLRLSAVGEDDKTDSDFTVSHATSVVSGKALVVRGRTVKGVEVLSSRPERVAVEIVPRRRVALAVKVEHAN